MKTGSFIEKIQGGKLLKVTASFEETVIVLASIRGDFFAHPEDVIESMEKNLVGANIANVCDIVLRAIEKAELYGISGNDIIRALEACHAQTQIH